MLVEPVREVSGRRIAGSRIAGIGGPWRPRSQIRRPGIDGARRSLRIGRQGRPGLRRRVLARLRLRRGVGMHLGLRSRMPLVLRMRRLLVGRRRGMRLRGRMLSRRSSMRGIVLSANWRRQQRQGYERGSRCCPAPFLRPGCALHLLPDLTVSRSRNSPGSHRDPGHTLVGVQIVIRWIRGVGAGDRLKLIQQLRIAVQRLQIAYDRSFMRRRRLLLPVGDSQVSASAQDQHDWSAPWLPAGVHASAARTESWPSCVRATPPAQLCVPRAAAPQSGS